jgi:LCP family protein required for cell wall assembly
LRTHGPLKVIGLVLTAVLVSIPVGAFAFVHHYQGNVTSTDVDAVLGDTKKSPDPKDPDAGKDLNILVLGSDTRAGANSKDTGDHVEGQRSDTAMIVHIAADRKRIDVVSIPRDSIVNIPACKLDTKGTTTAAVAHTMFNNAFAYGADQGGSEGTGALCAWQTVEANTGISLDGFVVVDFQGFKSMVDAVGGVPVCVAQDIDSPKADHLKLSAGKHVLTGQTALDYARAREGKGLGDGSDLGRITRQQNLVAATMNKVVSENLLTDSPQLLRFLDAATKSLSVSKNLGSVTKLTGLAYSLRHVHSSEITFMTIPNGPDPTNPNRVVWTSAAPKIWDDLRQDKPIGASTTATKKHSTSTTGPSSTATSKPKPTSKPTVSAEQRAQSGISAAAVSSSDCD